jgi:hypothetical protein
MNCVPCQAKLEDFLYGELKESQAAEVRAHLEACGACSALREQLELENSIFARFYEETALEPTEEMWRSISARIRAEPAPQPQPESGGGWMASIGIGAWAWLFKPVIWRQAGFAVLLIAISVSATIFFFKRSQQRDEDLARRNDRTAAPATPKSASPTPGPSEAPEASGERTVVVSEPAKSATERPQTSSGAKRSAPAARQPVQPARRPSERELLDQQIARAVREYRSAIQLLDRAIAKRRAGFDPELVKQYESSLALIDESIAASRRAFRERPGDPASGQFLLAAYARKVELMQEIALR